MPNDRCGRQKTYSNAAMQTYLPMRVLFGMALSLTNDQIKNRRCLVGLERAVPDFSTPSRRQMALR